MPRVNEAARPMPRAHIEGRMRAKAAPRAAPKIPRAGDSPHGVSALQPSCVSCVLLGKRARANVANGLATRLRGLFILLPRDSPARHQEAAEQITKAATETPEARQKPPNFAKYRSFQRLASLSDGPPLSSSAARQLVAQAIESAAVLSSGPRRAPPRGPAVVGTRQKAAGARPATLFAGGVLGCARPAAPRCDAARELPQF